MDNYNELKHFKFWCQKILPLVYDDSLSYYEVLCKVVDYINKLIDDDNAIIDDVNELKNEMNEVQKWIDNFDTSFIQREVAEYIAKTIKRIIKIASMTPVILNIFFIFVFPLN